MRPLVKVEALHPDALLPVYVKEGDRGASVFTIEDVTINPLSRVAVRTGIALDIPDGWGVDFRPRSGLAFKDGLMVVNSPGTIENTYTGEIKLCLFNSNTERVLHYPKQSALVQMLVTPAYEADLEWTAAITKVTNRGSGGFGSTGVSYREQVLPGVKIVLGMLDDADIKALATEADEEVFSKDEQLAEAYAIDALDPSEDNEVNRLTREMVNLSQDLSLTPLERERYRVCLSYLRNHAENQWAVEGGLGLSGTAVLGDK